MDTYYNPKRNIRNDLLDQDTEDSDAIELSQAGPAPAPYIPEDPEDMRLRIEAAALTILDMNRFVVTPQAKAILDEQFIKLSLEYISKNINFLASYGIIPPTEEFTGGSGYERPTRTKTPTTRIVENRETDKLIAELEEAVKNKRLNAPTLILPHDYRDLADYIREAVEGICNNNSASGILRALFPKPADLWMEMMKKDCRDVYEPSGIETQCNNTIGKVNHPEIPENHVCYICGFGFDLLLDDATFEEMEGIKPTCEHILPIIQAIFFLDLYRSAEQKTLTSEKMQVLKLEYAWAHRCCNYIKGDFSYLVTKLDKNKYPYWDFSPNSTNKILSTIYNTERYKGSRIIQSKIGKDAGSKGNWLEKQLYSIGVDRVAPILNYINSRGNGGTLALIGLSNCLDTNKINTHFLDLLNNLKNNANYIPVGQKRKRGGTRRKYGIRKTKRRSI